MAKFEQYDPEKHKDAHARALENTIALAEATNTKVVWMDTPGMGREIWATNGPRCVLYSNGFYSLENRSRLLTWDQAVNYLLGKPNEPEKKEPEKQDEARVGLRQKLDDLLEEYIEWYDSQYSSDESNKYVYYRKGMGAVHTLLEDLTKVMYDS